MTDPNNGSTSNQGETGAEGSLVESDQIELARHCMEFVSQYRTGSIPKIRAINEIFGLIFESELGEEIQDKVTGRYLGLLEEVKRSFSNPGGANLAPTVGGSNEQSGSERAGEPSEPNGTNRSALERARNEYVQHGESRDGVGRDAGTAETDERLNDEFSDELDYQRKPWVNVSKLPWQSGMLERAPISDPILRETQRQLTLFSQDPKTVISDLRIAGEKPSFPASEWENIIYGYAIDLDRVYASISTGRFDYRQTTGVKDDGSLKSGSEIGKPKRLVSNAGSWIIAWTATQEAICFVSKHRQRELQAYGNHIMSLFAIHEGKEEAVIKYDKVVREKQAAENAWTLKDFDKFTHLQLAILAVQKQSEAGPQRSEKASRHNRLSEICNNYNLGACSRNEFTCYRRHVCSACKLPGHINGDKDCKAGKKN